MPQYDNHRELTELVAISESRIFRAFLDEHKAHLQKDVNAFIRQKDLLGAYGALQRLDDIDKVMDLMKKRIFDIRKETGNG